MVDDEIEKILRKMPDYAREEARKKGTYIVYMDDNGCVVREYPDGRTIKVRDEN
ncbi:hypothetical protein [Mesobacillus maritimus]|uniref:hypothetical protein n=1 Tax=Mesobacillus maritimus TaxID=1643336 RepID=UPI003850EB89